MRVTNECFFLLQRLTLAGLLAAHGWTRLLNGGVPLFGGYLDATLGLPEGAGIVLAGAITAFEIIGTVLWALGKYLLPLSLVFSSIYIAGIVLVHAPEGWFVVGAGRNGCEYSVLLIVLLLTHGLREHARQRQLLVR